MNILRTRQVETCPDPQVHSRTQILWLQHQCFSYCSMLAHRKTIVCKTMGLSPGAKYCAFQLGSLWSLRNRLQIVHRTENHNPLNEHKLTRASFCKYCGWWLPSSHSWHLPPSHYTFRKFPPPVPGNKEPLNQPRVLLPSTCSPVARILLSCAIYLKSQVTQRGQNE